MNTIQNNLNSIKTTFHKKSFSLKTDYNSDLKIISKDSTNFNSFYNIKHDKNQLSTDFSLKKPINDMNKYLPKSKISNNKKIISNIKEKFSLKTSNFKRKIGNFLINTSNSNTIGYYELDKPISTLFTNKTERDSNVNINTDSNFNLKMSNTINSKNKVNYLNIDSFNKRPSFNFNYNHKFRYEDYIDDIFKKEKKVLSSSSTKIPNLTISDKDNLGFEEKVKESKEYRQEEERINIKKINKFILNYIKLEADNIKRNIFIKFTNKLYENDCVVSIINLIHEEYKNVFIRIENKYNLNKFALYDNIKKKILPILTLNTTFINILSKYNLQNNQNKSSLYEKISKSINTINNDIESIINKDSVLLKNSNNLIDSLANNEFDIKNECLYKFFDDNKEKMKNKKDSNLSKIKMLLTRKSVIQSKRNTSNISIIHKKNLNNERSYLYSHRNTSYINSTQRFSMSNSNTLKNKRASHIIKLEILDKFIDEELDYLKKRHKLTVEITNEEKTNIKENLLLNATNNVNSDMNNSEENKKALSKMVLKNALKKIFFKFIKQKVEGLENDLKLDTISNDDKDIDNMSNHSKSEDFMDYIEKDLENNKTESKSSSKSSISNNNFNNSKNTKSSNEVDDKNINKSIYNTEKNEKTETISSNQNTTKNDNENENKYILSLRLDDDEKKNKFPKKHKSKFEKENKNSFLNFEENKRKTFFQNNKNNEENQKIKIKIKKNENTYTNQRSKKEKNELENIEIKRKSIRKSIKNDIINNNKISKIVNNSSGVEKTNSSIYDNFSNEDINKEEEKTNNENNIDKLSKLTFNQSENAGKRKGTVNKEIEIFNNNSHKKSILRNINLQKDHSSLSELDPHYQKSGSNAANFDFEEDVKRKNIIFKEKQQRLIENPTFFNIFKLLQIRNHFFSNMAKKELNYLKTSENTNVNSDERRKRSLYKLLKTMFKSFTIYNNDKTNISKMNLLKNKSNFDIINKVNQIDDENEEEDENDEEYENEEDKYKIDGPFLGIKQSTKSRFWKSSKKEIFLNLLNINDINGDEINRIIKIKNIEEHINQVISKFETNYYSGEFKSDRGIESRINNFFDELDAFKLRNKMKFKEANIQIIDG